MNQANQRMVSQDIAKGIAILLVVMLHILEVPTIVRSVIGVLFGYAMPFFVFMSGYNYRNKGYSPLKQATKRICEIFKKFFIYSFIIGVIMTIHFVLNGEATIGECVKSYIGFLLSRWGTSYVGWDLQKVLFQRVFGPIWFIQFLIPASFIFYLTVDKAITSAKSCFITVFILATISAILIELGLVLPWGLQDSFAIAAIMILAAWCKVDNKLFKPSKKKIYPVINCIICLAIIITTEAKHNTAGYIAAGEMSSVLGGPEVYVSILIAFCGSYFLINFTKLLEKVPVISTCYSWLGRHSLQILFIHLPLAHLIIDLFGYQQMVTEYPVAVETISIDQVITLVVTLGCLYGIITLIDKLSKKKTA